MLSVVCRRVDRHLDLRRVLRLLGPALLAAVHVVQAVVAFDQVLAVKTLLDLGVAPLGLLLRQAHADVFFLVEEFRGRRHHFFIVALALAGSSRTLYETSGGIRRLTIVRF